MTAARHICSSLLSFIVIFTFSSRFLAINSALWSISVQRSHLFSQSQDLRPVYRVFGWTFHRSTSSFPSCDVRHDIGSTQPYQAILLYSHEGLLKLRVTGRRSDQEVLNIISLALFGTETVVLDDDIGGCTKENHAQTMGNHHVQSLYACLVITQLININNYYNHVMFLFIRHLNNDELLRLDI